MANVQTYKQMLREIIREQGSPETFKPSQVALDNAQLAIALVEYDHIVTEAADEGRKHLLNLLSGLVPPMAGLTAYEEIGFIWCGNMRDHALRLVRQDAELLADEMANEERVDHEFEVTA